MQGGCNDHQPLTIVSWPQAILHVDGDSFFAAVEQSLNPHLKGKPVVTGQERGIAVAISKEGKALGITRGMPIAIIKRNYPKCVIVPGNYEAYLVYAQRMYNVLRRYTPAVEEYSIDEAFADITGLRNIHRMSYSDIAKSIQADIERDLDITVSVGVSLSKSLAKLGSKFRKPHGITCVEGKHIHILLQKTSIKSVWGFGKSISSFLEKHGCVTAYDFVKKPLSFVERYLTKKEVEIYKELRGEYILKLETDKKESYKSISKAHTFKPSGDRTFILAQLSQNIEKATYKCRKYKLAAKKVVVLIKDQQFNMVGCHAVLNRVSNSAIEIMDVALKLFGDIYKENKMYRTTACILAELQEDNNTQLNIFESVLKIEKLEQVTSAMDRINRVYGSNTIHLALSLPAKRILNATFSVPQLNIKLV